MDLQHLEPVRSSVGPRSLAPDHPAGRDVGRQETLHGVFERPAAPIVADELAVRVYPEADVPEATPVDRDGLTGSIAANAIAFLDAQWRCSAGGMAQLRATATPASSSSSSCTRVASRFAASFQS